MNDILAKEVGELLKERHLTLGVVESASGGLISSLITDVPGSSDYYQGSITSYSNNIKIRLAGVRKDTLDKYGAVSAKVAEEMAAGGGATLGVDICITDTGIAGPTGATRDKPVGLFYIGLWHHGRVFNRRYEFKGDRRQNKEQAARTALEWLKEYLINLGQPEGKTLIVQVKEVVTAFLESNHKILILRRSDKVGTYRGLWAGISGYIETTPDQQVLIEIKEETGLESGDVKLVWKGPSIETADESLKTRWIIHPYLFKVRNPGNIKIDWEHQETRWIKPAEISNFPTVPKLKEALDTLIGH